MNDKYDLKVHKDWADIVTSLDLNRWAGVFPTEDLERLKFSFGPKDNSSQSNSVFIAASTEEPFNGEIRREGQRTLKPGANVWVQLKQAKGTKKSAGFVVECFEDNTVLVEFDTFQKRVPVNEYISGRSGTWSC